MLKIGKDKNLILYRKEGLFTSTFWVSLAIASLMHLFLFFSFHVKQINVKESERKFSTAYIEMNASLDVDLSSVGVNRETIPNRNSVFLALSTPEFYVPLRISRKSSSGNLNSIETSLPRTNIPDLKIDALGSLEERTIFFPKSEVLNFQGCNPFHFCCEVQIDNRTGEIFDYALLKEEGISCKEEIVHKIIKAIKFNSSNLELISVGVVEVFATFPVVFIPS